MNWPIFCCVQFSETILPLTLCTCIRTQNAFCLLGFMCRRLSYTHTYKNETEAVGNRPHTHSHTQAARDSELYRKLKQKKRPYPTRVWCSHRAAHTHFPNASYFLCYVCVYCLCCRSGRPWRRGARSAESKIKYIMQSFSVSEKHKCVYTLYCMWGSGNGYCTVYDSRGLPIYCYTRVRETNK